MVYLALLHNLTLTHPVNHELAPWIAQNIVLAKYSIRAISNVFARDRVSPYFHTQLRYFLFTNIDVTFLLTFKFANQGTKEVIVSTANWVLVGILRTIGDVTRNIAINCMFRSLYYPWKMKNYSTVRR